MHGMPKLDYSKTPFLIIWETTQACDLACRHCRASARPDVHPGELSTREGEDLLRQATEMGTPVIAAKSQGRGRLSIGGIGITSTFQTWVREPAVGCRRGNCFLLTLLAPRNSRLRERITRSAPAMW